MNVLFATPYLAVPPDFGGARRMFELIRGERPVNSVRTISLVGPGADVETAESELGPVSGVRVPFTANMIGTRARRVLQLRSVVSSRSSQYRLYHHPAFEIALNREIARHDVALVQFEFSQMGGYHVAPGVLTVLDVHNVEHDLLRQMASTGSVPRRLFASIEYRKFRREEIHHWRTASQCIATSRSDAAQIERHIERSVQVIPNGVDLDFFTRTDLSETESGLIVFTGAMRYRPNAQAAHFFVDRIFPLIRADIPDARFVIVGADPSLETLALGAVDGVTVTGTVPDIRPWMRSTQVVVVPLCTGGGTRLKILEAFAAGRPVVSTTIGAEGIEARDREHLLIADHPAEFAARIVELIRNPALGARLTDSAFELVRTRYQWRSITTALNRLHMEMVEEHTKYAGLTS